MNAKRRQPAVRWCVATGLFAAVAAVGLADAYSLEWFSVDAGGVTWMNGATFLLGGTAGQPDPAATTLTGGNYELIGGFWAAPPCWCPSDLNNDGRRDGRDVQRFVDCMLSGGDPCACADRSVDGRLDVLDVPAFVEDLLDGQWCP